MCIVTTYAAVIFGFYVASFDIESLICCTQSEDQLCMSAVVVWYSIEMFWLSCRSMYTVYMFMLWL